MRLRMPPNGFAGTAQQTAATMQTLGRMTPRSTTGTRRRRTKMKARRAPARRVKRSGKRARLVKGSAAAKRYMAKIRRKRR